jgi:hypothetical protein
MWELTKNLLHWYWFGAVIAAGSGYLEVKLGCLPIVPSALQIILDLCIPEKGLAKTRSQIHFYISKVIQDILSGTTRSQKEL